MNSAADRLLPDPTYRITSRATIDAPRALVWNELVALPMSSLPLGFALTLLRHLPAVLAGTEQRVRGSDTFLDATPIPVLITDEPRRLVSAGLSQAWKLTGGDRAPALDRAAFERWSGPGWIKVVMSFDLDELSPGSTRLTIETRVAATDPATARRFAPYWWAIRAGSALIRREVVARVKRRAGATYRRAAEA